MIRFKSYPNRVESATSSQVLPAPIRHDAGLGSVDYLPLIQNLVEMRQEQPTGIVTAFTAITPGQGVTYVVESLACQLAQHTGDQILLTSGASLAGAARVAFWDLQRIQRLGKSRSRELVFRNPAWEDLQALRHKFGFVLVDCPALQESSAVLALAKLVDGVALVVAAGEARREEIEAAQKALRASAANVVGLILNKRTDPVPRLLSRLL
jgi:hypothetical protein